MTNRWEDYALRLVELIKQEVDKKKGYETYTYMYNEFVQVEVFYIGIHQNILLRNPEIESQTIRL